MHMFLVVAKLLQSCPTFCDPVDCSPQGSSVHGILQARIRKRVAMPGDLPDPGIEPTSPMTLALQVDSLLLSHQGSPVSNHSYISLNRSMYLKCAVIPLCMQDTEKNKVFFNPGYLSTGYLILHMIICIFQCCSLNSSLPIRPHSVSVSLFSYVCISSAALHIGSSVQSFQVIIYLH